MNKIEKRFSRRTWTASVFTAAFVRYFVLIALFFTATAYAQSGTTDAVEKGPGLIELWASGKPAFGEYVTQRRKEGEAKPQKPARYTVQTGLDLAANPLLDYAFLNLEQHYDADSVRNVVKGLRGDGEKSAMALLVRIPPISKDGADVARQRAKEVLDLGADGVVLPHVRSAEEARTGVGFFDGVNVWSPTNPDGDIIVMLLVEDPDVMAELDEIASIPGYSALACGIGSLTQAMGGDREAAEVLNQKVLARSKEAGMVDLITADTKSVEARVKQGFLGLLVYGSDANDVIRLGRAAADR